MHPFQRCKNTLFNTLIDICLIFYDYLLPEGKPMINIVWGFNGTIVPMLPYTVFYDSDHILLDYLIQNRFFSFGEKIQASMLLKMEERDFWRPFFRKKTGKFLEKKPSAVIEAVSKIISLRIPEENLEVMRKLQASGYNMYIASCSVGNIISRTLEMRGADNIFKSVCANDISVQSGMLSEYNPIFLRGRDKIACLEKNLGLKKENTVVIGCRRDDVDILDWSRYPILIDQTKKGWERFGNRNYVFLESFSMIPSVIHSLTAKEHGN